MKPRFARTTMALLLAAGLATAGLPSQAAGDAAAELTEGKFPFTQGAVPACAACHTLADAGAEGAIGPVLDELKPDAARVVKATFPENEMGNKEAAPTGNTPRSYGEKQRQSYVRHTSRRS